MKRGTILKFSKEGLDWLSGGVARRKEELILKRFEFQCVARNDPSCISVKPVGKYNYQRYHRRFLEEDREVKDANS